MSARKEYELLFQLRAAMAPSFSSSFKQVDKTVGNMQRRLTELNGKVGEIDKYRKLQGALGSTKKNMSDLEQEQKRLISGINATNTPTTTQYKNLAKVEQQLAKTKAEISSKTTSLASMGQELRRSGVDTNNLVSSNRELETSYQQLKQKQEEYARVEAAYGQNRQQLAGTRRELLKTVGAAAAVGTALYMGPVKSAKDFESSMSDVAKVVDGLRDATTGEYTAEYHNLRKELLDLSTIGAVPLDPNELAKITEAAGQANVAYPELAKFTEDAAKMGVAFDSSAEQSGEWMAKWRTAFNINQNEVVDLADKINYLGNTSAASAQEISEIVTRTGPLGDIAGLGSGDIAAIGAAQVAVGIRDKIAATGIKKMITTMTAGTAATDKQAEALNALGFDATEMAGRMQVDAKGAILDFLGAVNMLPKEEQTSLLSTYFGEGGIEAIAPLVTRLELLEENFNKVGDAAQYAGSMEAEYEAQAGKGHNKDQIAKNAINRAFIETGQVLLPLAADIAERVAETATSFANFASENPETIKTILKLVAGFVGLRAGGLAVKTGFLEIQGAGLLVKKALLGKNLGIPNAVAGMGEVQSSTGGLIGMLGMLPGPVKIAGLAIGAVGLGFLGYREAVKRSREATLNFADGLSEAAENFDTINAKADETQGLITEYRSLETQVKNLGVGTDEAVAAQERMREIEQKLIDLNPEILSAHDAENGKLSEKLGLVEKISERERESAKRDLEKNFEDARQALPTALAEADTLTGEIGTLNIEADDYGRIRGELYDIVTEYKAATAALGDDGWISEETFKPFSDRAAQVFENENLSFTGNIESLETEELGKYNELADEADKRVKEKEAELAIIRENVDEFYNSGVTLIELDLGGSIEEKTAELEGLLKQQRDLKKMIKEGSLVTGGDGYEEYELINKQIDYLQPKLEDAATKAEELNNKISEAPEFVIEGVEATKKELEDIIILMDRINRGVYLNMAGMTMPDIYSHARGGIVMNPILTTFAEEGPEAAIPLDGSARAKSLWMTAGRMLGMDTSPTVTPPTLSPEVVQSMNSGFTYNDYSQINVDGNRPGDLEETLAAHREKIFAEVENRMRNNAEDKGRRAYGN